MPSRNSEFSHPEVVIGLPVLAYRYEGLRQRDLKSEIKMLRREMDNQYGPFTEREARSQFNEWLHDAAEACQGPEAPEVLDLELFQVHDPSQISAAQELLSRHPPMILDYLLKQVFPKVMAKQLTKLQASGVDLGGEMLFGTRLGFSGTPSDLLPKSLQPCHFEPGSEAEILRTLSSKLLVTSEEFCLDRDSPDFNPHAAVTKLLEHVAASECNSDEEF